MKRILACAVFLLTSQAAFGASPGPGVCIAVEKPVCATNPKTHLQETYPNECYAKQAGAVIDYQGECLEVKSSCPLHYVPVCGRSLTGSDETYTNLCFLKKAGAEFLHNGKCTMP
jgi:hypothetical protein